MRRSGIRFRFASSARCSTAFSSAAGSPPRAACATAHALPHARRAPAVAETFYAARFYTPAYWTRSVAAPRRVRSWPRTTPAARTHCDAADVRRRCRHAACRFRARLWFVPAGVRAPFHTGIWDTPAHLLYAAAGRARAVPRFCARRHTGCGWPSTPVSVARCHAAARLRRRLGSTLDVRRDMRIFL